MWLITVNNSQIAGGPFYARRGGVRGCSSSVTHSCAATSSSRSRRLTSVSEPGPGLQSGAVRGGCALWVGKAATWAARHILCCRLAHGLIGLPGWARGESSKHLAIKQPGRLVRGD